VQVTLDTGDDPATIEALVQPSEDAAVGASDDAPDEAADAAEASVESADDAPDDATSDAAPAPRPAVAIPNFEAADAVASEDSDDSASDDSDDSASDDDNSASDDDEPVVQKPVVQKPVTKKPVVQESVTPGFAELGLPESLVTVLDRLGYEEPTPIQTEAIGPLLKGRDLLGQAATGTGKTAAFALPLLARMIEADRGRETAPFGLIIVPTRELAMQVSEAVHTYGRAIGARVLPVYGGQPINRQLQALKRGVDIVVATPGRAVDHLSRRSLDLSQLGMVVLDEADEMLDMGFAEDLDAILEATPAHRQTALFSATMPKHVAGIARRHQNDPVKIRIERDDPAMGSSPQIREQVVVVARHHKADAITRLLDVEQPGATIIFCRTRTDVDELTATMNGRGYRAEALHGGMDQRQRDRVMSRLRDGTAELLVATDVAARGLDVDLLTHVVNHSLPVAAESYVHRIGRVGRAGREGVAITLVEPREARGLQAIERHVGRTLTVGHVPTVQDLRARRLAQLTDRVREAMLRNNDVVRPVLDALADDEDAVTVALAALAVLHEEASGSNDEREVPQASLNTGGKKKAKWESDAGGKGGKSFSKGDAPGGKGREAYAHKDGDTSHVWLSIGRNQGVRPKDIVGAVCGETSLSGGDLGAIVIQSSFSLVEVPTPKLHEVVNNMGKATIRGKKVHAKPDVR
jgi:ATP-dependent RNA helicase DeaD